MFNKANKQLKLKRTIKQTNIRVHSEVSEKNMEDTHISELLKPFIRSSSD